MTGAIQGTSQEELGLETLKSRRWLKRLCCMYKIINIGIPKYLTDLIPKGEIGYNIRYIRDFCSLLAKQHLQLSF